MAPPRFIEVDGRRYLWRNLVALRYTEPSLFTVLERNR
jgi:hypothetical protein